MLPSLRERGYRFQCNAIAYGLALREATVSPSVTSSPVMPSVFRRMVLDWTRTLKSV